MFRNQLLSAAASRCRGLPRSIEGSASILSYLNYIHAVDQIDVESKVSLPVPSTRCFAERGWQPRAHQLELLARTEAGESTLLIAPTGAGKTLAGFLPSLTDLTRRGKIPPGSAFTGIHTLYISPLKALAVDIE